MASLPEAKTFECLALNKDHSDKKISKDKKKNPLSKFNSISFSSTTLNRTGSKSRKSVFKRQNTMDWEFDSINASSSSSSTNTTSLKAQKVKALDSFKRWREQTKQMKDNVMYCVTYDSAHDFEFPDTYTAFDVELFLERRYMRRLAIDDSVKRNKHTVSREYGFENYISLLTERHNIIIDLIIDRKKMKIYLYYCGEPLVTLYDCNYNKGCHKYPVNCKSSEDCDIIVTWQPNITNPTESIYFEVLTKKGSQHRWVANSFNKQAGKMDGSYGEVCLFDGMTPMLRSFITIAKGMPPNYIDETDAELDSVESNDDTFVCRYSRPIFSLDSHMKALNDSWYIVNVYGTELQNGNEVKQHAAGDYRFSNQLINIASFQPKLPTHCSLDTLESYCEVDTDEAGYKCHHIDDVIESSSVAPVVIEETSSSAILSTTSSSSSSSSSSPSSSVRISTTPSLPMNISTNNTSTNTLNLTNPQNLTSIKTQHSTSSPIITKPSYTIPYVLLTKLSTQWYNCTIFTTYTKSIQPTTKVSTSTISNSQGYSNQQTYTSAIHTSISPNTHTPSHLNTIIHKKLIPTTTPSSNPNNAHFSSEVPITKQSVSKKLAPSSDAVTPSLSTAPKPTERLNSMPTSSQDSQASSDVLSQSAIDIDLSMVLPSTVDIEVYESYIRKCLFDSCNEKYTGNNYSQQLTANVLTMFMMLVLVCLQLL